MRPARAKLNPPKTPVKIAPTRANRLFTTGINDAINRLRLPTNGPRKERVAAVHWSACAIVHHSKENLLNPKMAMMLFNAPPISSSTLVNVPARPVGSAGFTCLSAMALVDSNARLVTGETASPLMSEVVSTTSLLMEAMAAVNVLAALALFSGDFFLLKAAAVESEAD